MTFGIVFLLPSEALFSDFHPIGEPLPPAPPRPPESDGACWLPLPCSFSMGPMASGLSGSGNPAAGEARGSGDLSIPGQSI